MELNPKDYNKLNDKAKLRIIPLPEGEKRIETGPTQIGNDWMGLFIRGDEALYLGLLLNQFVNNYERLKADKNLTADNVLLDYIKRLCNDLQSCNARNFMKLKE